jgi:hypothetical protein
VQICLIGANSWIIKPFPPGNAYLKIPRPLEKGDEVRRHSGNNIGFRYSAKKNDNEKKEK